MNFKTIFQGVNSEDILDNHPDGVIIINYQKNIIFWNKRAYQIFGLAKKKKLQAKILHQFSMQTSLMFIMHWLKAKLLCLSQKQN